jgi:hypothetical protein
MIRGRPDRGPAGLVVFGPAVQVGKLSFAGFQPPGRGIAVDNPSITAPNSALTHLSTTSKTLQHQL